MTHFVPPTDEQIVQLLRHRAAEPPAGLLDEIIAGVTTTRQVRRWPWSGPASTPGRGMSSRSVAILVATAVLITVALAGAVVVGSRLLPAPSPAPGPSHQALEWTGPVRVESAQMDVELMAAGANGESSWDEAGVDATVGWVNIQRVGGGAPGGQFYWRLALAEPPPAESAATVAYGMVLETTGDAVADWEVGIEWAIGPGAIPAGTSEPVYEVWLTNLATGATSRTVGPPYGMPVDFNVSEQEVYLSFLVGTQPPGLTESSRLYAWSSTTVNDDVIGFDYAPDDPWLVMALPEASEVVYGWPDTTENAAGVYSWDGSDCSTNNCVLGFMHNGYGSGNLNISIASDPGALTEGGAAATVAGHDGVYRRIDDVTEEWVAEIGGTTVVIRLWVEPGTSATELAEAHAIIDSMRTEPRATALGFRLVFTLTTDDWDSG